MKLPRTVKSFGDRRLRICIGFANGTKYSNTITLLFVGSSADKLTYPTTAWIITWKKDEVDIGEDLHFDDVRPGGAGAVVGGRVLAVPAVPALAADRA